MLSADSSFLQSDKKKKRSQFFRSKTASDLVAKVAACTAGAVPFDPRDPRFSYIGSLAGRSKVEKLAQRHAFTL